MDCERLQSHQSDLSPQIPSAFLTGKWGSKLSPSLLHELTIPELLSGWPGSLACLLSAKGYCAFLEQEWPGIQPAPFRPSKLQRANAPWVLL